MLTEEDLIAAQDEELQELEWGTIPAADKFEREEAAAEELDAVHKLEEGLFWAARAGNVEVATAVIQLGASAIAHRGEWVYGPRVSRRARRRDPGADAHVNERTERRAGSNLP